tara:strand:+ start:176 stop:2824 length:2649 start_codon:yes stop_codon:yes gene_type:complete
MIKEILLLHHSHTDIGYTSPQPVIFELHKRYIEQAIELAEKHASNKNNCQFKWTCEVTGMTIDWWKNTTPRYRKRFLKLHHQGLIDVAGCKWHMTPLMDHQMIIENLEPIKFLRNEGMKINYAMDCDINGVPWGMADALIEHNIKGFSMAINEFYGHALKPWPSGFYWETPTNKKLLAYNGPIYGATASHFLKIPFSISGTKKTINHLPKFLKKPNYSYDFFMAQITNTNHHDNAPPNPDIIPFLEEWNDKYTKFPIRMVTLTEFFEKLEKQNNLPTLRGDWSDWWNFGSGSTPNETRLNSAGQKALRQSNILNIFSHNKKENFRRKQLENKSKESLGLYSEHTWGADRSINFPNSDETKMQWIMKQVLPYEGLSIARMLRRDGIEKFARSIGGNETTTIAFNSLPYTIKSFVKVPKFKGKYSYFNEVNRTNKKIKIDFDKMHDKDNRWIKREMDLIRQNKENSVHRQDMTLSEINPSLVDWIGPVTIPALTAKTIDIKHKPSKDLKINKLVISNRILSIQFAKNGGIDSIFSKKHLFVKNNDEFIFGLPVLEFPKTHKRTEIFKPVEFGALSWASSWNNKWKNIKNTGTLLSRKISKKNNYINVDEIYNFLNDDQIDINYKLFTNTSTLTINLEIIKKANSKPHSLYLPLTINTGRNPKCHFETAGAVIELDKDHLPFACRHFITTQNWISYHGSNGGVTIASKDCPLWQVGGLNFGKFNKNNNVERKYKMISGWLYNNYWNTNFLADESKLIKFDFVINFEKKEELLQRVENIMPYIFEPIVHTYQDRGKIKGKNTIQLFKILSKNIYITDAKTSGKKSSLYLINYSNKNEIFNISSGAINIKKVRVENIANKLIKNIKAKKGSYTIKFKPHEWKIVSIY